MMRRLMFPALMVWSGLGFAQTKIVYTGPEQEIIANLKKLRSVPDDKRGEATRILARNIRSLAADPGKLSLAQGLASLSTEGDYGHETLQEVAVTLAQALQEVPTEARGGYSELAQLIRYEHVQVAMNDPRLDQAMTQLAGFDRERENADFTLSDLAGKAWSLKQLRGKVVVVNFWATWCPPCRKEMPDLSALFERFREQGLVVLAISDEEAKTVSSYLAEHPVSYTVLLDPGRKVNETFHVDGIPKSFVYDREGKLAAQAIDMRTRGQFLEMLRQAGINVK